MPGGEINIISQEGTGSRFFSPIIIDDEKNYDQFSEKN
jgi:hypothetical protein